MITCSLATMTMASQGAEVIKIEPTLKGDKMRQIGKRRRATYSSDTQELMRCKGDSTGCSKGKKANFCI